jgi:predicted RNA-binding Zn ribbon-like protein
VDILPSEDAQHLLREAERRQAEADAALEYAIALRETIYRIFAAVANEESSSSQDLDLFNDALCEALTRLRIVPTSEGFEWGETGGEGSLKRMLWPVVRSAADLLTLKRLDRVKQCPGCGWLFLDMSRNRSRRWCTMQVCGNRAKARRYYERQRTESFEKD